jgi:hypothetical protein
MLRSMFHWVAFWAFGFHVRINEWRGRNLLSMYIWNISYIRSIYEGNFKRFNCQVKIQSIRATHLVYCFSLSMHACMHGCASLYLLPIPINHGAIRGRNE